MSVDAYTDAELIRLALKLAVGTRLTDLCNELGVSTATGNALQERWVEIAIAPSLDRDAQDELARIRVDYEAQLEAVHDLTETLAEERVQHAAQIDRLRVDLLQTSYRLAEWHDALGAVVPELEREMAPERPRLVGP